MALLHLSSTALSPSQSRWTMSHSPSSRRRLLPCCSSKKKEASFTDRILDYIEGGPKLRKWYGAPDLLPKDGDLGVEDDENPDGEEERDAVLVTDGESEIGQMVILLLILRRARVKALVKDKRAAIDAFGTYVEAMAGDINDTAFLTKTLIGVRAIICASNDGFFSDIGRMKGVQHIVILSQLAVYRGSSGLQAIMNSKAKMLAERDEETVIASGIPYTIILAGLLQNTPGGKQGFCFEEQEEDSAKRMQLLYAWRHLMQFHNKDSFSRSQMERKRFQTGKNGLPQCSAEQDSRLDYIIHLLLAFILSPWISRYVLKKLYMGLLRKIVCIYNEQIDRVDGEWFVCIFNFFFKEKYEDDLIYMQRYEM